MTQQTKPYLLDTLIPANLPTNGVGFITAARLRQVVNDMVDSYLQQNYSSGTGGEYYGALNILVPQTTPYTIADDLQTLILSPNNASTAIQPVSMTLNLPSVSNRGNLPLIVIDWAAYTTTPAWTSRTLTLHAHAGESIMRLTDWQLLSSPDSLSSIMLYPSVDLLGWFTK